MATYDDYNQPPQTGGYQEPPLSRSPSGSSGKALASLLLGLISICGACFTGVPAVIVGFMSLGDIKRSNGRLTGSGMAYLGIISGVIFSLCWVGCGGLGGFGLYLQQSQMKEALEDNPVLREHIGTLDKFEKNWTATAEFQQKEEDIFKQALMNAFTVEGPKGSGLLRARFRQADDGSMKLVDGTLEMKNGDKFELVPGDDKEKVPQKDMK